MISGLNSFFGRAIVDCGERNRTSAYKVMSLASYHLSTPLLVLSANRCDAERSPWCRHLGLGHHHRPRSRPVAAEQTPCLWLLPVHLSLFQRHAAEQPWLQPLLAA